MLHTHIAFLRKFYISGMLSGVFLVILSTLAIFPVANSFSGAEATSHISETILTLSTDNIALELDISNPSGTFAESQPTEMTVTTNNYTGYTFAISANTDDEDYSKLINGEYAFNSISSAGDPSSFNNGNWGYKPSKLDSEENEDFLPAPTFEGDVLDVTDAPNTEANEYTISLGVKADYSLPSGKYNNTFVIAAIANPVHYTINYDAHTSDEVEDMPESQAGDTAEESVELSSNTPTRLGYNFTGWCSGNVTSENEIDSCDNVVYIPGEVYEMDQTGINEVNLTAMWSVVNYNITYTLNGGSATNPTSYNAGTESFTLNNPTRNGYTFKGWSGTGLSGDSNTSVTIPKGSTGDRSYTANWTIATYTISYNLNSGSATNPTSYNVETNTFTLNNPTRNGYTFTGWTGSNGSTAQTTVTIAKGSTGNKTYTANWTPVNYSISYTLNGGSVSPANPASYNIETASFTLRNPTRNGYTFTGWTGSNGSTAQTTVTIAKGSTGNKTYTANWTPVNYSISYTLNNGSVSPANPTSYNIETASFTLRNPTRNGYTFTGWTGSNGSTAQTTVTIAKGSTGNKTYTANWTANKYTVTLNQNGGSGGTGSVTATYGSAMPAITKPTRTGYTFNGYYTATSGGTQYYNANGASVRNWDKTSATTLYAQWSLTWTKKTTYYWAYLGTTTNETTAVSMCNAVGGSVPYYWQMQNDLDGGSLWSLGGNSAGAYWTDDDYAGGKTVVIQDNSSGYYTSSSPIDAGYSQYRVICRK